MLNTRNHSSPPNPPPPSVADEVSVSASQFKTYERCPRKWWFEKVAKVKDREKQHFVVGHALHERAEIYQIGAPGQSLYPPGWDKGLDEDERAWIKQCADMAISFGMWQRVPGRLVEFPVCMLVGRGLVDSRGMPLLARADVYLDEKGVRKIRKPSVFPDGRLLPGGWDSLPHYNGFIDFLDILDIPLIGDHKSAKSRKYALTPEKLGNDTQMLCYSAAVCSIQPQAKEVDLRHNYFLKDPMAPTPVYTVNIRVPFDRVATHWGKIVSWSEEMAALRKDNPAGLGLERADKWHQVPSAIQSGNTKEGCEAYGGCPFRDVCFGRASSSQVLARLDSPDPFSLVKPPEVKFGLNIKNHIPAIPAPPATAQENNMAFNRPAPTLTAGQDVYILDPENPALQFRARIDVLNMPSADPTKPSEANIILWPDANVEPDFSSLGSNYRILVPKADLLGVPPLSAKIVGYAQALRDAGVTDGVDWKPAVKPTTSAAVPAVETAKAPSNEKSPLFGLKVPAAAAAAAAATAVTVSGPPAPAANAVITSGIGTIAYPEGVTVGTKLLVAASDASFWKPLIGKTAIVRDITPSDIPGRCLFTVEIDGNPYPDVLPTRFMPVPMDFPMVASCNIGKLVHVEFVSGAPALNTTVEQVTAEGFVTLAGTRAILWGEVKALESFDEKKHVPDRQPTKEEKAEAKAAAKAEKAAAKEATKAGPSEGCPLTLNKKGEVVPAPDAAPAAPAAPESFSTTGTPLEMLDQAVYAVETALTAGKVTRKLVEGIVPILRAARDAVASGAVSYQAPVNVTGGTLVVGDSLLRGSIRTAINHAIGVLNEAAGKIPE